MHSIELGKTGARVSELCLGCMLFGSTISKETSYELLDEYVKRGGNFLDTANEYAFWIEGSKSGTSEELLGNWMEERENREHIFLATKVGANPVDLANLDNDYYGSVEGLSREAILKSVEGSLKRLKTDYIDLLYTHIDYRDVPLEETLETLNELVAAGKVKHIGCSNLKSWRIQEARSICKANNWTRFSAIQQGYTYLNPRPGSDFGVDEPVDDSLLDYLNYYQDMTLLAYSPLLGGYYTRKDKREHYWRKSLYENAGNQTRLETLSNIAKKYRVNENQVVLAWMLRKDTMALPIIAASRLEQLIENIEAADIDLSKEDLDLLDKA